MLINSPIEVTEKLITVNMQVRGAEFLIQRKLDEALSNLIFNLLGIMYKIKLIENISEETMHLYEEKAKRIEKLAIEKAMEEVNLEELEQNKTAKVQKEESKPQNPEASKVQAPQEAKAPEESKQEEEKTPLIYGRSMNIKEVPAGPCCPRDPGSKPPLPLLSFGCGR